MALLRPQSAEKVTGSVCGWVDQRDTAYLAYHDSEWGVPVREDAKMFELLVLESFQAGLAWITILRKREAFRIAFDGFDPATVAAYGERDIERLLGNAGIVRSRAKIVAAIHAAQVTLDLAQNGPGLAATVWSFVGGRPIQNEWAGFRDAPTSTPESIALSNHMKSLGIKFFGPVIAYAFMQAAGLVNDHEIGCPRHGAVRALW
jgi:DNA-3-methyladenine glycosylase I